MATFLLWIGLYNAFGSLVLATMHDERIADFVLRRVTEVVAEPYRHGEHGRMWLWWAASTNAALGVLMMLAVRWPPAAQREVVLVAVGVYVVMYVVLCVGARRPKFARGIWTLHALWLAQMAWGLATVL